MTDANTDEHAPMQTRMNMLRDMGVVKEEKGMNQGFDHKTSSVMRLF